MLTISKDLKLPLDEVCGTFVILGIRNSGKSHTASVMAEEMLKAGQPIVVYDPTSAWWGLKSSADGKRPAYPVVIFGGEHADVPLEETAGETIAATIVEKRIPAILDCSLLRKGARVRFMTTFAETLYHKNREALHLFLDEAHTVAPQNIRAMPEASRLLGAIEDIILQGRRRGLGMTVISPRPAIVNANLRSACQTLIAMRVGSGKLDRKAIEEWVEAHGDAETAKEMMATLASLPKGDGWVWNPAAGIFKRVHFRERETFDSSATPKIGGKVVTPQRMAQVDLDALGEAIKATVEKAKADDPKELRRQLADVKAQLAKAASAKLPIPGPPKEFEQKLVAAQGELKLLREAVKERDKALDRLENIIGRVRATLTISETRPAPFSPDGRFAPVESLAPVKNGQSVARSVASPSAAIHRPVPRPAAVHRDSAPDTEVGKGGMRRMMIALAQRTGLNAAQLGLRAGLSSNSGTFTTYIGKLRANGWISGDRHRFELTAEGLAALGDFEPLPTGPELLAYWLRDLGDSGAARMLQALADVYPRALTKQELGEAAGMNQSGTFTTYLGKLRRLELVEGRGELKAAAELFEW